MNQRLRRTIVMRKDYPGLNMVESIERRMLDEGFKLEDIINIESSPSNSWQPGNFVIVWTRSVEVSFELPLNFVKYLKRWRRK